MNILPAETPSTRREPVQLLQFGRLTTAHEWALAYRQRGLPALADGPGLVLIWTRGDLAALHMPAFIGLPIQDWLRHNNIFAPILCQSASGEPSRYTLLAKPDVPPRVDAAAALSMCGVTLLPDGTPVRLPSTTTTAEQGFSWMQAPDPDRGLPLLSAVVCAARATMTPEWAGKHSEHDAESVAAQTELLVDLIQGLRKLP